MKVTVRYFASLRAARGCDVETIETDCATARELYGELEARGRLGHCVDALSVCINRTMCTMDSSVHNGDEVVYIPPVAGG